MSALQSTKAHYERLQSKARRVAALQLRAHGLEVTITNCSRRSDEAMIEQWGSENRAPWDWDDVFHKHSEFKALTWAVWGPDDRLASVGLMTLNKTAVTVRFVEGDPRSDCPFKGKRVLIALEIATNYAQANGLSELRIQPLNDALSDLYQNVYGFSLVKNAKEEPYYKRMV